MKTPEKFLDYTIENLEACLEVLKIPLVNSRRSDYDALLEIGYTLEKIIKLAKELK